MRRTAQKLSPILAMWLLMTMASRAQDRPISIAIADFRNSTGWSVNDRLQKTVPEMLKTELAQTGVVTIVERSRLEAVFGEQALSQSGVVDAREAQKVGRLVGAEYILSGEMTRTGDRFRIDAHLVSVESGEMVGEKVTGPDEAALEAMIRVLAKNIAYHLSGKGEALRQLRIHRYPYQWPCLGALAAGVAAAILHQRYEERYRAYRQSRSLDVIMRRYDEANSNYRARNAVIGVGAICLSAGMMLWLKDHHRSNIIFAWQSSRPGGSILWAPYFAPGGHPPIGITVSWRR